MWQIFAYSAINLFQFCGTSIKEKEKGQHSFSKICILLKEKIHLALFYAIIVAPDDNQKERMEIVA